MSIIKCKNKRIGLAVIKGKKLIGLYAKN